MKRKIFLAVGTMMVVAGIIVWCMGGFDRSAPADAGAPSGILALDDATSSLLDGDQPTGTVVSSDAEPISSFSDIKNVPKKKKIGSNGVSSAKNAVSMSSLDETGDGAAVAGTSVADTIPITADPSPHRACVFPANMSSVSRSVIINEIAWMGTPSSSSAEWIELKNMSGASIDLSGWSLLDAAGKIKVAFSDGDMIAPGKFFLLMRGGGASFVPPADSPSKTYSGDLANGGVDLALLNAECIVADHIDAGAGWPGGSNAVKATLERDADGNGWHTSAVPGGTPGAENSIGVVAVKFPVSIVLTGAAGGSVKSIPSGIVCGTNCIGVFASGTHVTFTAFPLSGTSFGGWAGGPCVGTGACAIVVSATTTFTAEFVAPVAATSAVQPSAQNDAAPVPAASSTASDVGESAEIPMSSTPATNGIHVLISAVQIAGASSSNDLVRLYNPIGTAVDLSGWKLHKRSQTGTEYSLKTFPAGSVIAAGATFVWANAAGGFADAMGADVSSTETLSADNSVALIDAAGVVIDAVAWGNGNGQYGEGPPYPANPLASQLLVRMANGGVMADTENNSNDFIIQ